MASQILRFKVFNPVSGKLITTGTNPTLSEKDQVLTAVNIARSHSGELHMWPVGETSGMFLIRPRHLDITDAEALTLWGRRKTIEQLKGNWAGVTNQ